MAEEVYEGAIGIDLGMLNSLATVASSRFLNALQVLRTLVLPITKAQM